MPIFFFLLGAVTGSFINVCVHRMPRDLSIVSPGSRCPKCLKPIAWRDNIPILSYFLLRARCRHCRAPISFRYMAVELVSALALLGLYLHLGLSAALFFFAFFFLALLLITFIDLEHQLIPVGEVVLPGIVLGFAMNTLFPGISGLGPRLEGFLHALAGALVGAGVILAVARLGRLAFRKEAMGEGDIWLMAMIGAFLGWRQALMTILAGSFAGSLAGVALIAVKARGRAEPIPFGPFLSLGALFSFLLGERLIDWYLGLL